MAAPASQVSSVAWKEGGCLKTQVVMHFESNAGSAFSLILNDCT